MTSGDGGTGDKVMFEIYRVPGASVPFRVIYYTELDEEQRDDAIADALAGESVADGYLREAAMPEARAVIAGLLTRLNAGEPLPDIRQHLAPLLA